MTTREQQLARSSTIGHDQISQTRSQLLADGVTWTAEATDVFVVDGHGSVRMLLDGAADVVVDPENGSAQQVYHFDAYGNLLNFASGVAPLTAYLYSGESFDFNIGQQYLRARWYDATTGRFNRLDPFAGNASDPQSFHKYAYVHGDPVNGVDPTGKFLIGISGVTTARITHAIKTIHTGIRLSRGIQALAREYNAGLRFYHLLDRLESGYELFQTILDLLEFDVEDLREIRREFAKFREWVESGGTSGNISSAASVSSSVAAVNGGPLTAAFQIKLGVPLRKQKAIRNLLNKARRIGTPALIAVQEKIGESLMYAAAKEMGFTDPGLTMHGSNGFDQLMQHSSGLWAIFEAKGGNSGLGKPKIGDQMSGKWIDYWIKDVVRRNPRNTIAMNLQAANANARLKPMLAVVTRFNAYAVKSQITITGELYRGPGSITSWPSGT